MSSKNFKPWEVKRNFFNEFSYFYLKKNKNVLYGQEGPFKELEASNAFSSLEDAKASRDKNLSEYVEWLGDMRNIAATALKNIQFRLNAIEKNILVDFSDIKSVFRKGKFGKYYYRIPFNKKIYQSIHGYSSSFDAKKQRAILMKMILDKTLTEKDNEILKMN